MEKASLLKKRVYAITIDLGIIVTTNAFLVSAFNQFTRTVFFHLPVKMQLVLVAKSAYMASISLMALTFAYFTLFNFLTDGRTLGKSFFGIKASSTSGEELTLKQSMLRASAQFTCAMLGSFLFALSWIRKDEKSLADIFAGTIVIEEKSKKLKSTGTEFEQTLDNVLVMSHPQIAKEELQEEVEYFEQNKAS